MTLTCTRYTSQVLPNGRIQLQLDEAQQDPAEERMSIPEIAKELRVSTTTVYRLSTRKRNPLPLTRGNGRPYGLRSRINRWLIPVSINALKVFGL